MKKGSYCLLIRANEGKSIRVGALGEIYFLAGYYIYTGSALGSGGLSRVSRHIRFFRERYRKPKWHIDYLMEEAVLIKTFCAVTEERLECTFASAFGGACVARFGCSDCNCKSHLFYRVEDPEEEIREMFSRLGVSVIEHEV